MKAVAVFPRKPNSVHLADLPKPSVDDVSGGRGVLVKVLRVGVDGTDKEINAGEYGAAPDGYEFLILGHEGFGRVEAVGPKVTEVQPGDYVVATVRRPGGSLYDVIGTNDMTTDDTYFERGINLRHGFLTEYYVDDAEFIVKVPRGLREVGVLLEPMTVVEKGIAQAYEIQRRLRVWRPRRAAVMGAGTIGLLATLALRLRGLDVTAFGLNRKPHLNADLIEAIGGRYQSTADLPILEGASKYGPFDVIFEATGYSPVVFDSMQALAKNGVLVLSSVTGGDRKVEVPADKINLQFVLGNKVMVGTVNANREYFEMGVRDMAQAEAEYSGWLQRLLTHPVKGLENYRELFDKLTTAKGAIKVFCEVAELGPMEHEGQTMTVEEQRLAEARDRTSHWRRWGPYLAERQWGTVREDYSPHGTAWDYFPHDHARSRAYRWGEDGLLGISDNHQRLCFALALWNEKDPILKERLFGLTGSEGNHGEDVKEYYFYLDNTPTHSYMRGLYKYPQAEYPYARLVEENRRRGRRDLEFELLQTGVFDEGRYFDVAVEYAKAAPEDVLIRITVTNRGPEPAPLHLLPTLWFRNTWSWVPGAKRPRLAREAGAAVATVVAEHPEMGGPYRLSCEGEPELLFTENESNSRRLWGVENPSPYVKDAFHEYVVHGNRAAVNPAAEGTKAAAHYRLLVEPGQSAVVRVSLAKAGVTNPSPARGARAGATATVGRLFDRFDETLEARRRESDEFYATVIPRRLGDDATHVMRQALAGMLWSKQWFHFDVRRWLEGDPTLPPPPPERKHGRNQEWAHLYNDDVVSMPDKWEYPWYAAWDLAFHTIALALVDPEFAKDQLVLFLREWYMHPNGQVPAYEWAFGDVNPPVHAWAAWRVYKIDKRIRGVGDRQFLARVFHKLLLNFTWWINRKDPEGKNVFQGGFLGLDNIGVFDRSAPLPTGGHIEQSDGTAWMGMYCLNMLAIALELAREDPAYEDTASKFFEHFMYIAQAMSHMGDDGVELWNEEDGFFYDVLHTPNGMHPMKVRSLVGLVPLFSVHVIEPEDLSRLPQFERRMRWFLDNREDLCHLVTRQVTQQGEKRRLLSLVSGERLERVLRYMLDEREFLSPYGIRALSAYHRQHPYIVHVDGVEHRVDYEPAESSTGLFGGNSNWRGPIWFPMNFLIIESLQRFDHFWRGEFKVEFPAGSGQDMALWEVATERLSRRLTHIFLRGPDGRRPVHGGFETFQKDPHWKDLILFYEYFHGDDGAGIGASHQTGWTGLVAKLLQQSGE